MKLTQQVLRTSYLHDLKNPDIHHGRQTPKVRNIAVWEAIGSMYKHTPRSIDPYSNTVWVWSDIHFGHNNIIKYTAPFRPFESVQHMNESLIRNYMDVVKPDDIVIWGGDISFMSTTDTNLILDQLPGYKIQIVGNHDMDRKGNLRQLNFDERHLCMVVDIQDPDQYTYQLHFTHYPLDKVPSGCHNIHGHIHQYTANRWNTNISVEQTQCAPVKLSDLLPSIRQEIQTR